MNYCDTMAEQCMYLYCIISLNSISSICQYGFTLSYHGHDIKIRFNLIQFKC